MHHGMVAELGADARQRFRPGRRITLPERPEQGRLIRVRSHVFGIDGQLIDPGAQVERPQAEFDQVYQRTPLAGGSGGTDHFVVMRSVLKQQPQVQRRDRPVLLPQAVEERIEQALDMPLQASGVGLRMGQTPPVQERRCRDALPCTGNSRVTADRAVHLSRLAPEAPQHLRVGEPEKRIDRGDVQFLQQVEDLGTQRQPLQGSAPGGAALGGGIACHQPAAARIARQQAGAEACVADDDRGVEPQLAQPAPDGPGQRRGRCVMPLQPGHVQPEHPPAPRTRHATPHPLPHRAPSTKGLMESRRSMISSPPAATSPRPTVPACRCAASESARGVAHSHPHPGGARRPVHRTPRCPGGLSSLTTAAGRSCQSG